MNITITDTAYGGFGVGRGVDGKALFVPFTVTGDVAEVTITEDKKSFAYARLDKIITPSPLRTTPTCPYAGQCGGCLFPHIKYDAQLQIKEDILKNAFRKYPNPIDNIKIIHGERDGYRLRATFRAENGKIGFYAFKSRDFIPVQNCLIVKKSLFEKVKAFAEDNSLTGEIYAIETDEGTAFAHIKTEIDAPDIKSKTIFDGFTWNGFKCGLSHTGYNTPAGPIGVGHKTFFQANRFLLNEFQSIGANAADTALDITELYAGAGFFTAALMKISNQVKACEIDGAGCNLARKYSYPIKKSDAGDFLEKIKDTDVLFMDPARDGVSNKVITNILRIAPRKIVYVSCNPTTLARDAIKISKNYKITNITMLDMFPDTFHVETVAEFIKI